MFLMLDEIVNKKIKCLGPSTNIIFQHNDPPVFTICPCHCINDRPSKTTICVSELSSDFSIPGVFANKILSLENEFSIIKSIDFWSTYSNLNQLRLKRGEPLDRPAYLLRTVVSKK